MQTHETPTLLKTPPHCSAIWYSNCYVLEVSHHRIHAGRTTEKRDPTGWRYLQTPIKRSHFNLREHRSASKQTGRSRELENNDGQEI